MQQNNSLSQGDKYNGNAMTDQSQQRQLTDALRYNLMIVNLLARNFCSFFTENITDSEFDCLFWSRYISLTRLTTGSWLMTKTNQILLNAESPVRNYGFSQWTTQKGTLLIRHFCCVTVFERVYVTCLFFPKSSLFQRLFVFKPSGWMPQIKPPLLPVTSR